MRVILIIPIALLVVGCAGRAPQPVSTVQPQDASATCTMLRAEIEANNLKITELAADKGLKVAQNVVAGVGGVLFWPLWFGMDFQGTAGTELAALNARQQYLTTLATERCRPAPEGRNSRRS